MEPMTQTTYCKCKPCSKRAKGAMCAKMIYNENVLEFSRKKYNKELCYSCQGEKDMCDKCGEKITQGFMADSNGVEGEVEKGHQEDCPVTNI